MGGGKHSFRDIDYFPPAKPSEIRDNYTLILRSANLPVKPRVEVTQVADAKLGDDSALKIGVRLLPNADGVFTFAAKDVCIQAKGKPDACNWSFLSFFPNAKSRGFNM